MNATAVASHQSKVPMALSALTTQNVGQDVAKLDFLELASALIGAGELSLGQQILEHFNPQNEFDVLFKKLMKNHQHGENLYLEDLDSDGKQINIFNVILKAVPTVKISTQIALNQLLSFYAQREEKAITLVNIGIGKGHFEAQLLEVISKENHIPEKITVIGIDIDQSSVDEAEQTIKSVTTSLLPNTEVHYHGICEFAEQLSSETCELIRLHEEECLAVVSAFSMHHIQGDDDRTRALATIKSWNPGITVLVEPDVDHFTDDYKIRVQNSRKHFGKVFEVIDQLLECPDEKFAVKNIFFAREMENILQTDETARYEKHEDAEKWIKRLHAAGFDMKNIETDLPVHPLVGYQQPHPGVVQTHCGKVPMVSVITAR